MEKKCETCGDTFSKRTRDSLAQWMDRAFCSLSCANIQKKTVPPHLYFWDRCEKSGENDCWPWSGICDEHGYGRVIFMTSKVKAHRVSYEMRYGPIPDGLLVRHKCDNPNCVNPNHLELGTQKDNANDMSKRGRLNPISAMNLRPGKSGFHGAGPVSNKDLNNGRSK